MDQVYTRTSSRRRIDKPALLCGSAGVGRTGTYIAVDTLMNKLREQNTVDVYGVVYRMRLHRPYMVQTPVTVTRLLQLTDSINKARMDTTACVFKIMNFRYKKTRTIQLSLLISVTKDAAKICRP